MKYKNIFTILHTQPKPGNIITASYLLYCIVIYFIVLHIIFIFTCIHTLCLTTTRWSWGHKNEKIVLQVARRRTTRAFATVPREFDINPEFPCGENLLLLQHSALGVPTWHTFLVSSCPILALNGCPHLVGLFGHMHLHLTTGLFFYL
jgi:hypothetical protein